MLYDKHDLQDPKYRSEIVCLLGLDESVIERKFTSYFYDHLACALSYVKVYNLMAENKHHAACVLEDDAVISSDFLWQWLKAGRHQTESLQWMAVLPIAVPFELILEPKLSGL